VPPPLELIDIRAGLFIRLPFVGQLHYARSTGLNVDSWHRLPW
jgi:hypothetical protein